MLHSPRIGSLLALLLLLALSAACEKPAVGTQGEALEAGGIEFRVLDYDIRFIETVSGSDVFEYPRPLMVIPVQLTNTEDSEFPYSPTHTTQQMSEASTPLLYVDPGAGVTLPPDSKIPIPGVYLERGTFEGQVQQLVGIPPGQTITDYFLFEVPEAQISSLVFSLPPTFHRGKMPVLFRVPYFYREPAGPTVYSMGQDIVAGDMRFRVTGSSTEYVKTSDTAQGEGFSSEPLYRVNYVVENRSAAPVNFDPGHRVMGGRAPGLFGPAATYRRVRFPGTTSVEGQLTGAVTIEPGESQEDFVLFEVPAEGVDTLMLEFPFSLFGESGVGRVNIDYEFSTPDRPKELEGSGG